VLRAILFSNVEWGDVVAAPEGMLNANPACKQSAMLPAFVREALTLYSSVGRIRSNARARALASALLKVRHIL
jgi:hypothetical protein